MAERKSYRRTWMQISRWDAKRSKTSQKQKALADLFEKSFVEATDESPEHVSSDCHRDTPEQPSAGPPADLKYNEDGAHHWNFDADSVTSSDTDDYEEYQPYLCSDDETPGVEESDDFVGCFKSLAGDDNLYCMSVPDAIQALKEETSRLVKDSMVQWATSLGKSNPTHKQIESLLHIFKKNVPALSLLPATARTLLNTPRETKTQQVSGMNYYNFGLATQLHKYLASLPESNEIDQLDLSLNIDGLPLYKSSRTCFWPILCQIRNLKSPVFPVIVTSGKSKPQDLCFLDETIGELKQLEEEGLLYDDKTIKVSLKLIVCDAPAKAMVKSTKLCTGYCGCDKCTCRGAYHEAGRKIVYLETEVTRRTNESFRRREQKEHHHAETPFVRLSIDMIDIFSVDYMHQVCLGVMRRLLHGWVKGKKGTKMPDSIIKEVNTRMLGIKKIMPKEFARKPRPITEVDIWKATEFRQFLLYTGPLVLKGLLDLKMYKHFMKLSVAVSILVSPSLANSHRIYAHELLTQFVSEASKHYGTGFMVYNVHSLLHLADETVVHGCLDACAAWPFEDYMQTMKGRIRSGKNPLVQLVRRIQEVEINSGSMSMQNLPVSTAPCTKHPNNAYRLESGKYIEVLASKNDRHICRKYINPQPLFSTPCDSRLIRHCRVRTSQSVVKELSQDDLSGCRKCIKIGDDQWMTFLCLLHEP